MSKTTVDYHFFDERRAVAAFRLLNDMPMIPTELARVRDGQEESHTVERVIEVKRNDKVIARTSLVVGDMAMLDTVNLLCELNLSASTLVSTVRGQSAEFSVVVTIETT